MRRGITSSCQSAASLPLSIILPNIPNLELNIIHTINRLMWLGLVKALLFKQRYSKYSGFNLLPFKNFKQSLRLGQELLYLLVFGCLKIFLVILCFTCGIGYADNVGPRWATCQLDPASSISSKRCSTADFRPSPFWSHNWRALQSSLASCSRAHLLQSRCTHQPSSEWQCSSVPVVLLHPSRLRLRSYSSYTNWLFHLITSLLLAGGPFQFPPPISRTEQSSCTTQISTVAHGFPTASQDFSLPALLRPQPTQAN